MREIKFRAWEKNLKEMIPINSINFKSHTVNIESAWRFLDEIELMQYTGLKDKNGVEIYEGDIARYHTTWNETLGIVKFGEYEQDGSGGEYSGTRCIGFYVERTRIIPSAWDIEIDEDPTEREEERTISILSYEYEVIGNIYENPELLERR